MDDAREYFHKVQRRKKLIKKSENVLITLLTAISILVVAACIYLYGFHAAF